MKGRLVALLLAAVAVVVACSGGDGDVEGERLASDVDTVLAASAEAMGEVTSVRFELDRSGPPLYIDPADALSLEEVEGRFVAPGSADALVTVSVGEELRTRLGAVAVDDTVWLSNPVTGELEPVPDSFDLDPRTFFDPTEGWRPLMQELREPVLVGTDDRGGERFVVEAVAPAERVEVITAGLVEDQDVDATFWIHPVSGLVTAVEFETVYDGDTSQWTLDLDDYGEDFEIEAPDDG